MTLFSIMRGAVIQLAFCIAPANAALPPRPEMITDFTIWSNDTLTVSTSFGHLYASTDDGASWKPADASVLPSGSDEITMTATNYTVLGGNKFRCQLREVEESTNGGHIWKKVGTLPESSFSCQTLKAAKGLLFAGTLQGLYESADRGRSWVEVPGPLRQATIGAMFVDSSQNLYVNTKFDTPKAQIFVSYKRVGVSGAWERIDFDMPGSNGSNHGTLSHGERLDPSLIGIVDTVLYASSYAGLIFSRNGGKNWVEFKVGLPDPVEAHNLEPLDVVFIVRRNSKGVLYAATMRHVYRFSASAKRWEKVPIGTPSLLFLND